MCDDCNCFGCRLRRDVARVVEGGIATHATHLKAMWMYPPHERAMAAQRARREIAELQRSLDRAYGHAMDCSGPITINDFVR